MKFQYTDSQIEEAINNLQITAYWTTLGHQTIRKLVIKHEDREIKLIYEKPKLHDVHTRYLVRTTLNSSPRDEAIAYYIVGYICYYGKKGHLAWEREKDGWIEEYQSVTENNFRNPTLLRKIYDAITTAQGVSSAQVKIQKAKQRVITQADKTKMRRLQKLFESHDFEENEVLELLRQSQILRIQNG